MTRQSLDQLIERVRQLIGDGSSDPRDWTFQDEQIQAHLDQTRAYHDNAELDPLGQAGDTKLFSSTIKFWDLGVVVRDPDGSQLALDYEASNLIAGHFVITDYVPAAAYVSGWSYDLYAVCADLLVLWAGRLEQDITKFSADGSSYEFAGATKGKLALAADFRAKSDAMFSRGLGDIQTVTMVRND